MAVSGVHCNVTMNWDEGDISKNASSKKKAIVKVEKGMCTCYCLRHNSHLLLQDPLFVAENFYRFKNEDYLFDVFKMRFF